MYMIRRSFNAYVSQTNPKQASPAKLSSLKVRTSEISVSQDLS